MLRLGPRPDLRARERSGAVKRAPFPLHPAAGVPVLTATNPDDVAALGGLNQGVRGSGLSFTCLSCCWAQEGRRGGQARGPRLVQRKHVVVTR